MAQEALLNRNNKKFGESIMVTNDVTPHQSNPVTPRRRPVFISGMVLRVLIALVISVLIVMAFFVSSVVSH